MSLSYISKTAIPEQTSNVRSTFFRPIQCLQMLHLFQRPYRQQRFPRAKADLRVQWKGSQGSTWPPAPLSSSRASREKRTPSITATTFDNAKRSFDNVMTKWKVQLNVAIESFFAPMPWQPFRGNWQSDIHNYCCIVYDTNSLSGLKSSARTYFWRLIKLVENFYFYNMEHLCQASSP